MIGAEAREPGPSPVQAATTGRQRTPFGTAAETIPAIPGTFARLMAATVGRIPQLLAGLSAIIVGFLSDLLGGVSVALGSIASLPGRAWHRVRATPGELRAAVGRQPAGALGVAMAIGFAVGFALRRTLLARR